MKDQTIKPEEIGGFYSQFNAPVAEIDCGKRCAPHNEGGKPFCCDICHAVPTGYLSEWVFLQQNTDLWHEWKAEECTDTLEEAAEEVARLGAETPDTMVLMACLGPTHCQRDFRALTCRQFPFFPYIDSRGELLGLSYYWEYEDVCWVMSNLQVVSAEYIRQFLASFEFLFERMPQEFINYKVHSEVMRDEFKKLRRAIPLLHRNGQAYKISSHNERMRRVTFDKFSKFGPYKWTADLLFPDEE
ncbi:MAG: hypothetical protein ABFS17_14910 [Chloroflexota bacterium]